MAKENRLNISKADLSELTQLLIDKKSDLFNAQQSLSSDSLANTNQISRLKREIARINTKINQIINQNEEEK